MKCSLPHSAAQALEELSRQLAVAAGRAEAAQADAATANSRVPAERRAVGKRDVVGSS